MLYIQGEMSNWDLHKFHKWVWPWPWTFNFYRNTKHKKWAQPKIV